MWIKKADRMRLEYFDIRDGSQQKVYMEIEEMRKR